MAMTSQERVRKQRRIRKAAGWKEVKVWVPSEEDAELVRQFAAGRRQRVVDPQLELKFDDEE